MIQMKLMQGPGEQFRDKLCWLQQGSLLLTVMLTAF